MNSTPRETTLEERTRILARDLAERAGQTAGEAISHTVWPVEGRPGWGLTLLYADFTARSFDGRVWS